MRGRRPVSDPGFGLVRAAAAAGLEVIAVPGPCAAVAALSIGAQPTDRFCFEGFLPARGAARRARLRALASDTRTLVFYESPHRVVDTLPIARRNSVQSAPRRWRARSPSCTRPRTAGRWAKLAARAAADGDFSRGEIVLIVGGAKAQIDAGEAGADGHGGALDRALAVLLEELPLKQAARLAAKIVPARDNEAYKRALR